ncbi:MAG TPA: hypothetical protein VFN92_10090 [Solirubrobacterales bacterium]|nr:hypothetical protein [Solirubrobacterales bacterium]
MEIQEFAPRHVVAQLIFKRKQATVVDRRGELAGELHDLFATASAALEPTAAEATTDDEMSKYRIGMAQLLAEMHVDGFEEGSERVETFFRRGMELLDSPTLSRVVAHTSDVAAVPSFDDLREALFEKLSANPGRIRDAVGVPVDDAAWTYNFADDSWIVDVRISPMTGDDLQYAFDAPDGAEFPDASLFVDVKVMRRAEDKDGDPLELWDSALRRNRQITAKLGAWLKEALA